jgi:tRNA nucleotidyltransferase/poly(A) polymerase
MDGITALLARFPALYEAPGEVYLVGGAIRDMLLNRAVHDLDFAVDGDAIGVARRVADACGADVYVLDAERQAARVLVPGEDPPFVLDFSRFRSPSIEGDLRGRDFSTNAMAVRINAPEKLIDPCGGLTDTRDKVLRACSPTAFDDDPLRILRGVRLAINLGFRLDPATLTLMKSAINGLERVSCERLRDELFLILEGKSPVNALRVLDQLGILSKGFPELAALQTISQTEPIQQTTWEHTLKVGDHLQGLWAALVEPYSEEVGSHLVAGLAITQLGRFRAGLQNHFAQPLTYGRSRKGLLLLAALLHDVGKPAAMTIDTTGVHFYDHHLYGAPPARQIGERLALSQVEVKYLESMVGSHMQIHFMARDVRNGAALTRGMIYQYFKQLDDRGVDLVLLSLADTLAANGLELPIERWQQVIEISRALLEAWFERADEIVHPPRLVDGAELMAALGLNPGPYVGELLAAIEQAQAEGLLHTKAEVLAFGKLHHHN